MYNLLIHGATIVDGTGNASAMGDIAVTGDTIVGIGTLETSAAQRTIDGTGLVAAPGFIDMHSHSDFVLPVNPTADAKVFQGVTTELVGHCGFSPAPISPENEDELIKYAAFLDDGMPWDAWESFGEFLAYLENEGVSLNVAPLVGQGTIRIAAMGFDDSPASASQLALMCDYLNEAMEAGAFGLSTGLIYPPGSFTGTDEIVELGRVAAERGGIYFSHIRGESDTLLDAVTEAIAVGERAGMPTHISHFKAAGRANWGKTTDALHLIQEARTRGHRVTADLYPYRAGATSLSTLLPPWAHTGGVDRLVERLGDPQQRREMRLDIEQGRIAGWWNPVEASRWEDVYISFCPGRPELTGLNLAQIAQQRGQDPLETIFDILQEQHAKVSMVLFMMDEADIRRGIADAWMMVGSDAVALAPREPFSQRKPHPRTYGTFPRFLRRYVRELEDLSLEEAIYRMTGLPAKTLRIYDRGTIRLGAKADLVLFDPETITDRSTYQEPHQYPDGIYAVVVNGQVVVENNEHTGARPGLILRLRDELSRGGQHQLARSASQKADQGLTSIRTSSYNGISSVKDGDSFRNSRDWKEV